MVIAVAPLGLIGVVAAMLPSNSPIGFVATLGVLALIGILIRNSVILIVQIEKHRRDGMATWEAVLESTIHRTRPIMLTAAAASLALIAICREGFWAPMAFAMMGGIIVGTLLTLLFLPALTLQLDHQNRGHHEEHQRHDCRDRSLRFRAFFHRWRRWALSSGR